MTQAHLGKWHFGGCHANQAYGVGGESEAALVGRLGEDVDGFMVSDPIKRCFASIIARYNLKIHIRTIFD